jgi:hypothetical protein
MPTAAIFGFLFGVFVSVLLLGGLLFTVKEMQRIGREAEAKPTAIKLAVPISMGSEHHSSPTSAND